jgi:hypothetical protein
MAASLTLNRAISSAAVTRQYAPPVKRPEVVQRQLTAWGDAREQPETARPRAMRSLERDLERVLRELSEGFPLLASLVEHRRGGQKRLPLGTTGGADGGTGLDPALALSPMNPPGADDTDIASPSSPEPSEATPPDRPKGPPPVGESPMTGGVLPR